MKSRFFFFYPKATDMEVKFLIFLFIYHYSNRQCPPLSIKEVESHCRICITYVSPLQSFFFSFPVIILMLIYNIIENVPQGPTEESLLILFLSMFWPHPLLEFKASLARRHTQTSRNTSDVKGFNLSRP